jgi:DUF4097 and DUF4098 domain-containing protein YvlB
MKAALVVMLALATPAYAQSPTPPPLPPPPPRADWVDQLEAQIEVHANHIAESIARAFEEAFDQRNPNPHPNPRSRRDRDRDDDRRPEVTERFSRTLRLGRNGTFEVSNIAGDIVITGGGGNDVKIDAVKRVRARDDADGKARLQDIQIQIDESANRVDVRTVYPRLQRNLAGAVDYTVALPQDASVTVHSVSGDVRVTNVRGELQAESVSGDVSAADVPKLTGLKSVSGDISLTNGGSDGPLDLGTVSGELVIKGLKARTIDVGTVSGDIMLDNVESERVDTKSVSGNVDYRGPLARGGRYAFNSHSGDITMTVSGNTGFSIEANTFSGDVRSDFAVTLRGDSGGRGPRRHTIRGSFGDGSATLSMNSFSGDIAILKR